jgi:hypothetical protein
MEGNKGCTAETAADAEEWAFFASGLTERVGVVQSWWKTSFNGTRTGELSGFTSMSGAM